VLRVQRFLDIPSVPPRRSGAGGHEFTPERKQGDASKSDLNVHEPIDPLGDGALGAVGIIP
jgi:hypothetical protein